MENKKEEILGSALFGGLLAIAALVDITGYQQVKHDQKTIRQDIASAQTLVNAGDDTEAKFLFTDADDLKKRDPAIEFNDGIITLTLLFTGATAVRISRRR